MLLCNPCASAHCLSFFSQFPGKERDAETGLDYFGARYFSGAQGRFTSVDPIWVKADRMLDPQRLNLYSYARNNPLKFTDPTGMELQIGNCGPGQTTMSCFEMLKSGLEKGDRAFVSLIKGTGTNGCSKGAYCVDVDQKHMSKSGNFEALKFVAGKSDIAILEAKGPNDKVSSFAYSVVPIKQQAGYEPTMNKTTGFMGLDLNPMYHTPVGDERLKLYSPDKNTHAVFAYGMSADDTLTTIYEELQHVFIGDFGRLKAGEHPQINSRVNASINETLRNMKVK
jgi:RHS repeat-associated protein